TGRKAGKGFGIASPWRSSGRSVESRAASPRSISAPFVAASSRPSCGDGGENFVMVGRVISPHHFGAAPPTHLHQVDGLHARVDEARRPGVAEDVRAEVDASPL